MQHLQRKSNGHASTAGRANGHALVSPSHAVRPDRVPDGAASLDARESPNAAAVSSTAAGTERVEYAEVAPSAEGEGHKPRGKKGKSGQKRGAAAEKSPVDIPPGIAPLPSDGPGFVDAMHAHVDLYLACARLVKSGDEKIAQRMVERLLEMSYGKSPSAAGEEAPEFVTDSDSEAGRRAPEGAKQ